MRDDRSRDRGGSKAAQTRLTLFATVVLLVGCFDRPIRKSVDLERAGLVIDQTIEFRHSDRYSFGFLFRPSFVSGTTWSYDDFLANESRAWQELCADVAIALADENGIPQVSERGPITRDGGWIMANGSQEGDFPATIYKILPFKPNPRKAYRITVSILRPCPGANALEPQFFINRVSAGP